MDVKTLLYRTRNINPADHARKTSALLAGYTLAQIALPNLKSTDFLARATKIAGRVLGAPAQDSYLTTVLSAILAIDDSIDVFLAGVLNAVVLQMNFQTRIFLDGTQSVIFDGAERYFPIAMLHGNVTLGIRVAPEAKAVALPSWANLSSMLEINADRLHNLPEHEVPVYQAANMCSKTGALLIVNPAIEQGDFSIAERYAYLADSVSSETIYALAGSAEMVCAVAADIQKMCPEAELHVKCYAIQQGGTKTYNAVMICSGIERLPDVCVRPGIARICEFGLTLANDPENLTSISYGAETIRGVKNGAEVAGSDTPEGIWETNPIRPPFYLSSSAPLPLEARERLSDDLKVFHSVLAIRDGVLIPSQDSTHSTFMYANSAAQILTDFGSDPTGTPLYRDGWVGEGGIQQSALRGQTLRRVCGSAMPLMFTPMLHKWHSHFMLQCLPRVRIARDLDEDVTILLPHDLRKKQLEMLEILGFNADNTVMMGSGELIQADRLLYPWPWRLGFTEYTAAIYDEIAAQVKPAHCPTPKRIIISREARKSWRNLINYDAIRQMLIHDFGFAEIAPEKLTLSEEVAVFSNAEIVVGAEGAGMYGAVFSPSTTKYIIFCDEDYVMPILGSLAQVRGFDVGYVFGESFRSNRDVSRRLPYGHADFVVDVERVRNAVCYALGSKPN